MGIFNVLKKRDVPQTLPDLGISSLQSSHSLIPKDSPILSSPVIVSQASSTITPLESKYKPLPNTSQNVGVTNLGEKESDQGFFRELLHSLTKEIDESKISEEYKSKVLSKDIVGQMKEYWEQQKPEMLLHNVGNDLKSKLREKTEILHQLEHDWQGAYFMLMAKEEKIREEERELKSVLNELMSLYQSALKDQESRNIKYNKKK